MIDLSFLDALKPDETDLPQLPQLAQKQLGQRNTAPEAKPQVPQLAPTENNVKVLQNGQPDARGEGSEQEKSRAQKTRYAKIGMMLSEDPSRGYALTTDGERDSENVILTLGIQGVAIVEFAISKLTYDAFKLLAIVDRQSVRRLGNDAAQPK